MKFNENPIMILLGIVLVGVGVGSFFGYRFFPNNQIVIYGVFALAALLIILAIGGNIKGAVGVTFTALWLVLMGLMAQFKLNFTYSDLILSILPLGAGAFMIIGL